MVNFTDHLDKKGSEIERPPIIPIGHYIAKVTKQPEFNKVGSPGNEFDTCDFVMQITCVVEADDDEIAEYGDVTKATVRHRFMFDKQDETRQQRSLFNLKRFLEDHLGCMTEKESIKVGLANAVGAECTITISHRPDPNDPEIKYDQVGRTAAVE